ncbi:MAG: hypothetical protein NTX15_06210 [Candidatus Kapabacteria bacterium]|nr:hypothetical protein [Candidatus Kapabacteria bacterium]
MRRSCILVVLLLVSSYGHSFGQSWIHEEFLKYGNMNPILVHYPGKIARSWSVNLSKSSIAIAIGQYVFVSRDSGETFNTIRLPIERSFYGSFFVTNADDSTFYISSQDGVAPQHQWVIRSSDRGTNWVALERDGSPYNVCGLSLATDEFVAAGRPLDSAGRYFLDYSTTSGASWQGKNIPLYDEDQDFTAMVFNAAVPLFDMAGDRLMYQLVPGGAVESRDGGRTWLTSRVPNRTVWFRTLSDSVTLAIRWMETDKPMLMRTSNAGSTWDSIVILNFRNKDTAIVPNLMALLRRDGPLAATFHITTGHVLSTTDGGESWIYRGSVDRNVDVANKYSTDTSYGTIIPQVDSRGYIRVPSGSFDLVQNISGPRGAPLVISSANIFIATSSALFHSRDSGRSWKAVDKELRGYSGVYRRDDPNIQPFEGRRLWWGSDGRLNALAVYDLVTDLESGRRISRVAHSLQRRNHIGSPEWYYQDNDNLLQSNFPMAISESNSVLPLGEMPSPLLVNLVDYEFTSGTDGTFLIKQDSLATPRLLRRPGLHFAHQLRNGNVIVAADSLLISSDSGRKWRTVNVAGLPLSQSGAINRITAMCEDSSGTIYAGLSGRTIMSDTTFVAQELGGIWKSTDGGMSWSAFVKPSENMHVLYMACDAGGVLYATSTQRTHWLTSGSTQRDQDFGVSVYVVRGDSLVNTFTEFHSGPIPVGNRVLRRDQQGAMLCASLYSGLLRSTNGGREWKKVGGEELDTVAINDVVVGTNNEIFIGTTKGVMHSDALATGLGGLQDDEDQSRRTTVWCYPTPATSILHVSLYNLDLLSGVYPRLTLVSVLGEEIMNLTNLIVQGFGSQRFDFDLDIGSLPRGVYGLALQASKHSWFVKVLIAK